MQAKRAALHFFESILKLFCVDAGSGGLMKKSGICLLAKKIWRATYIRIRDNIKERNYEKYWGEHCVHNGKEHADKTFYIIRRREVYTGMFSDFLIYVYKVKRALDHGYIPIIDMQTSENMYLSKDQIGKVNAWEYYFKQPCGYSLEDITHAANVIWGSGYTEECFPYLDADYLLDPHSDFKVYQKIAKRYFQLNDEAQRLVDDFYDRSLSGEKVLGVLCRGTDYTGNRPSGHPIQPDVETVFEKVDEVCARYQCTKIFLGTEDEDIYTKFREKYRDQVVTNRQQFIAYHGEHSIGKLLRTNVKDLKGEGMEYLVTIALLSRCNCFVGGHTSGSIGVMLLNDEFEYRYLFCLGFYP